MNQSLLQVQKVSMIDILVVGGGPTGLCVATEALRLGLTVRIIEQKHERQTAQSRALIIHARVMELLATSSNSWNDFINKSIKKKNVSFRAGTEMGPIQKIALDEEKFGDTPFPFLTCNAQFQVENVLEDDLQNKFGKCVEYDSCLSTFTEHSTHVVSTILRKSPTSSREDEEEQISSRWVIGCDGGRSTTRTLAGLKMDRSMSGEHIIIADVKLEVLDSDYTLSDDDLNAFVHPDGFFFHLCFSYNGKEKIYRIVAIAPKDFIPPTRDTKAATDSPTVLSSEYLEKLMHQRTGISAKIEIHGWLTSFPVSHGISNSFWNGKHIFIAGDAGHLHSPVGGQGMNYGILDGMNFAWKAAWAKRVLDENNIDLEATSEALNLIFGSYDKERRIQAESLIQRTSLATSVVSIQNPLIVGLRTLIMGKFAKSLIQSNIKSLAQLTLCYNGKDSPIIAKLESSLTLYGRRLDFVCKPGDRLPNLRKGSFQLYDAVDRSRHFWVLINPDENNRDTSAGKGGLKVVKIDSISVEDQVSPPVIQQRALQATQAILVRPDLYVAGIGKSMDSIWDEFEDLVGIDRKSVV